MALPHMSQFGAMMVASWLPGTCVFFSSQSVSPRDISRNFLRHRLGLVHGLLLTFHASHMTESNSEGREVCFLHRCLGKNGNAQQRLFPPPHLYLSFHTYTVSILTLQRVVVEIKSTIIHKITCRVLKNQQPFLSLFFIVPPAFQPHWVYGFPPSPCRALLEHHLSLCDRYPSIGQGHVKPAAWGGSCQGLLVLQLVRPTRTSFALLSLVGLKFSLLFRKFLLTSCLPFAWVSLNFVCMFSSCSFLGHSSNRIS